VQNFVKSVVAHLLISGSGRGDGIGATLQLLLAIRQKDDIDDRANTIF